MNIENNKEVWVDIIGYDGKYQLSNTGKVRSMNYNNTGKIKELKKKLNKSSGCYEVKLSKNNIAKENRDTRDNNKESK